VVTAVFYDVMGRPSQQSNPAEIDSNWNLVGDDAGSWAYSYQTYDWKGRPSITTNTDTTFRTVTYGGCGCAGAEVVTTQDEVGRQQRMTYDVLGRLVKTEALNMDQNHSVYATRTNTYNARDQITSIYVQQGTNGTGQ
jgi:YD repeat-containing protein